jgi:hypothetical protein
MDLEHFTTNFRTDALIGNGIALYLIASKNLASTFQRQNYFRSGVAGSREVANIDRSVSASGQNSKASSLLSRANMYLANNIQSMTLIACIILPASVINGPSGPTIARILETRNDGDNRPAYALRGKTMAVALEALYHAALDALPNVSRARRKTEWFKTGDNKFKAAKLALQSVGKGTYYDFTLSPPTAMPEYFVGKGVKLGGGAVLDTTTHGFKQSPRLKELRDLLTDGDEVEDDAGVFRLRPDDIADIRGVTPRGLALLDRITEHERPAKKVASPVEVRLTRAEVERLRGTAPIDDARTRRRLAREIAQLAR